MAGRSRRHEGPVNQKAESVVYVVSDGRGETCSQVVKAALLQFEGQPYRLEHFPRVRTERRVREIVKKASGTEAVIFYTLVGQETRRAMHDASHQLLVPTVDVLGPGFSALHDLFKQAPGSEPGLLYASEREKFDRQTAIDYTLKHDDGQRPEDLHRADVVVVGVSRASKSSTCFYLAYEGIKAANVPLVPRIDPPPQLLNLDPKKVIGLRANVMRLMTVRNVRVLDAPSPWVSTEDYVDKQAVTSEVIAANRLMDRHGWQSVDVSYMAIEEIAREVMRLRGLKG
jgi:regulator of PEP synthase PpsR (kinase-PPPase family)